MNHTREPKPAWSDVPAELRDALARLAGAPFVDAAIAWGGYGPSATFVLTTADNRKLFCKGTHPGFSEVGSKAFFAELSYYESLPELAEFGPKFRGAANHEDWHLMMLDYVARTREVPPWTVDAVEGTLAMLARFHARTPDRAHAILPVAEQQVEFMSLYQGDRGWKSLADSDRRAEFVSLFADSDAAARWLAAHLADLIAREGEASHIGGPRAWVHHDVRSDNLLFHDAAEPLLVDFPFLAIGPALMDVGFFLPSLAGEGGPTPTDALRLYERMSGHRFDQHDVVITVATVAGFFAARAGQPELPGLPRLRWVQKLQLFPSLGWLSQSMAIEPPPTAKPF
jgi:Phosphotransferase enzyme family